MLVGGFERGFLYFVLLGVGAVVVDSMHYGFELQVFVGI